MHSQRRLLAIGASVVVTAALTQVLPGVGASGAPAPSPKPSRSSAAKVDPKLGNGLGRLVAQDETGKRFAPGGLKIEQGELAIRDNAGRVLVDLTPQRGVDVAAFKADAAAGGFKLTAVDPDSGTLEGYVPLSRVTALASTEGLGTIKQSLRPITHAGATTSQGVKFQKVDKVLGKGVDGAGITVGVLSDSYDTATDAVTGGPIATHAAEDIASGDLPGVGNPDGDTQPIVVIEDFDSPSATDEGRGMLQIVHDVAPKAKLCFATAFNGDVGFANNIRKLADSAGPCKADVIVDDVGYFNEPFFSDGVISAAVDDVSEGGVAYFSSAGNAGDQNAWRSRVDLVPAARVPAAATKAGLDFSGVDPALYAGGLQDMNTGSATDVAQTLAFGPDGGLLDLQWNDPVDADGPDLEAPFYEDDGTLTAANSADGVTYTVPIAPDRIGQKVLFRTDGVPSGTVDLILHVITPSGEDLGEIDTGASPEVLATTIEEAGDYTVVVSGFGGATGDFTVEASQITAPSKVTTDFNVLLFTDDGEYLGWAGDDNTFTGQPNEVLSLPQIAPKVQLVIAKATAGATPVSEIGYINNGAIFTEEYFDPLAPATFGHSTAAGANGVAAIDPFKPYVNEYYTSPGGALNFYFDRNGDPFPDTVVRKKPDVASTDRGNTTFFVADDLRDDDAFPNFGGTSAAAPHAAAIAALVLDGGGGPGSLSPREVSATLKDSAFKHDLDPFKASGSKGGLRVSAKGAPGDERDATPASMDDPNFFSVRYRGTAPITRIVFLGRTASPTSLGRTPASRPGGLVWDPRALAEPGNYREGGFPFTKGSAGGGLKTSQFHARLYDRVQGTPFFHNLEVRFDKRLTSGQSFSFGIDRDLRYPGLADHPVEGNGADEIGGGVLIPQNKAIEGGMKFIAYRKGAKAIRGQVLNNLGNGWTPLDGYGVVNAYDAVFGN